MISRYTRCHILQVILTPAPCFDKAGLLQFLIMTKRVLIVFLLLAFSSQTVFAFFGTRPMGMGGAFTAVADDANAPYWNPAGLALNPEVSLTGSTLTNNRNIWVGDNVANLKMCYETEMNPFVWIAGVGLASAIALSSAMYLKDQGVVQKNWGRGAAAPNREQSVMAGEQSSEEVVSLKQELKDTFKKIAGEAAQQTKNAAKDIGRHTSVNIGLFPYAPGWYRPDYERPNYWENEPRVAESTKAQFALGLSWLNDYNATPAVDQRTNWYTLTLASGFEQRIAVGLGVNFYDLMKISSGLRGMGADLDVGVIAKPVQYISLGLVTRGVLTTDFHLQNGKTERGYPMLVNAGLAIKPIYSLTLAADAQNIFNQNNQQATMHYGAEAVLIPGLLARAGLSDGNKTAGLSLALGNLIIDYAILGGSYNRTQMVGGTWRF
jgi:hypothetical protein